MRYRAIRQLYPKLQEVLVNENGLILKTGAMVLDSDDMSNFESFYAYVAKGLTTLITGKTHDWGNYSVDVKICNADYQVNENFESAISTIIQHCQYFESWGGEDDNDFESFSHLAIWGVNPRNSPGDNSPEIYAWVVLIYNQWPGLIYITEEVKEES